MDKYAFRALAILIGLPVAFFILTFAIGMYNDTEKLTLINQTDEQIGRAVLTVGPEQHIFSQVKPRAHEVVWFEKKGFGDYKINVEFVSVKTLSKDFGRVDMDGPTRHRITVLPGEIEDINENSL